MLFRQAALDGLRSGAITLAFRRWRRPTVRAGGTLLTPVGQLSIADVTAVAIDDITDRDARLAGFAGRDALVRELQRTTTGTVYRIGFGPLRPDPRVALRAAAALSEAELADLQRTLAGLDARSPTGPWVRQTLAAIARRPAVRAGDLCAAVGLPLPRFKLNVRKLKALGLTESLEVGYRLSPRGSHVLQALSARR